MKDLIEIKDLKKIYNSSYNAVNDISLIIKQGEFVVITGKSGSGKSTLLNIIGGLLYPTSGKVFIDSTDLYTLKEDDLIIYRRENIGYIFQNFNLVQHLNVYENITLTAGFAGIEIEDSYLDRLIEELGLSDKLNSLPNELSGGEQQRVAIARALILKPQLLLADEPTGNLDSLNSNIIFNILKDINQKHGQTIVMITHDQELASKADRIIKIKDGKVEYNDGVSYAKK